MHFLYAAHVTDEHLTPDQQRVLRGLRSPTMSTGVETPSHNARPKDFNSAQDWVTAFFDKGAEEVLGYYAADFVWERSEEHTSELQSLMRISYAVFCLKKKKTQNYKNK